MSNPAENIRRNRREKVYGRSAQNAYGIKWGQYDSREDDIKFNDDLEFLYQTWKKEDRYKNLTRADILEFADRVASAESNRNPNALNPTTTASGLYQMTSGTGAETLKVVNQFRDKYPEWNPSREFVEEDFQYGTPETQILGLLLNSDMRQRRYTGGEGKIPFEEFRTTPEKFGEWYYDWHHTGAVAKAEEGDVKKIEKAIAHNNSADVTVRNFEHHMKNYKPMNPGFLTGLNADGTPYNYDDYEEGNFDARSHYINRKWGKDARRPNASAQAFNEHNAAVGRAIQVSRDSEVPYGTTLEGVTQNAKGQTDYSQATSNRPVGGGGTPAIEMTEYQDGGQFTEKSEMEKRLDNYTPNDNRSEMEKRLDNYVPNDTRSEMEKRLLDYQEKISEMEKRLKPYTPYQRKNKKGTRIFTYPEF